MKLWKDNTFEFRLTSKSYKRLYLAYCILSSDCGAIPAPLHGGVTYSNDRTTYKEVATFTCDVGYYLSYDEARTCEATGNWRGNTPECIIKGKSFFVYLKPKVTLQFLSLNISIPVSI